VEVDPADLLWAIALGVIQGITEFVPVSSSAHLLLIPELLGAENKVLRSLDFSVALHLGTAVAISAAMAPAWWRLVRAAVRSEDHGGKRLRARAMLAAIVLASVFTGIAGILLEDLAESAFREPALVATVLVVGGVLMYLVDRTPGTSDRSRFRNLVLAGSAQILALVPGVSRSGAIFSVARYLGLDRRSAIEFAFLLMAPVVIGAAIYRLPGLIGSPGIGGDDLALYAVGILSAAGSGYLVARALPGLVARSGVAGFCVYRVLLGLVVLVRLAVA
jgi:undecaprenyl-diphosphatase